ncbi:autism susceptibility gene 2 protein homolog isoform X2 [Conger conger]|uniref:autism susceptibility gene 2 protein homolog isoform X2 n=1 Tax=Conger conger TaxID=82655 RepID=UPI002A5AA5F0|nr:autism susceptibility gene 2 protein homolog isoform X2 [Conger conger]
MDGPGRSSGFRQSRRSRSQRDRERRRRGDLTERRPSSCSEREACGRDGFGGGCRVDCGPGDIGRRHRPPRRRKRESVSCEEDIIDGFAIASFISLEALEMDCSLKPPECSAVLLRRGGKRKRFPEENGGGSLSEPEAGDPSSYSPSAQDRARKRRRKRQAARNVFLETGYICDSESESGDKASDGEMEPTFTVSTRKVLKPGPVIMGSSVTKSYSPSSTLGGLPRLSVTPRVSGLHRSQERSLEPPYPDSLSSSSTSASSCMPTFASCSSATGTVPGQLNGDGRFQRRAPSPQQPKPKPFLNYSGPAHFTIGLNNRNSTSTKPPSSSASSLRPPTPSMNIALSLGCGPGFPGSMRPPSHPSSGAVFSPSPGLPPPPPLLQVPSHPTTELNSRFLTSQNVERDGGGSAGGNQVSGGTAPAASGGPLASSSRPGASGCVSQAQPPIPPLAFQFHQHNHQHTHTHQHFTPFLPPSATASPLFDKYPGKMESLYRHPFFPQYPPSMSGIQPVLPPAGPFSSLQGAFQPKGTSSEMAARLGPVHHHLHPKDPRKPGKWCAMHVRLAWTILRHKEKVKLLQVDPHKLDFRNNLLSRLPGAGGLGGLGGIGAQGSGLPSAHELARPASLFTSTGGGHTSASTFAPPSTPHSSFTASAHMDPFGRSPPFSSLGSLGTGAFGGLGSPSLGANSVFGHKESQGGPVGPNPQDPWNRLHRIPPSFPTTPSWIKGMDRREDRVKEADKEVIRIKVEKDRDTLYGQHPVRMSPAAPSLKLCSNTPVSQMNGLGRPVLSSGGLSEDEPPRTRSREKDRDTKHSVVAPKAPLPFASSSAPERPRSSCSSAPHTPHPPPCLVPSPLNLYARPQAPPPSSSPNEASQPTQMETACSTPPSAPASLRSLSQYKKPDPTTSVSVPKLASSHPPAPLLPPVKVKVERKDEVEPVPISLPLPSMPSQSYDQPSNCQHPAPSSSAHLSLGPPPSVSMPPPSPHPHHHPLSLSLLDRSHAAAAIEAYLGVTGSSGGIVVGAAGDRFPTAHTAPQGHSQSPHSFPWDPWRELAVQQQRDALTMRPDSHLALRTDPHLARLLQHQQVQRFFETERAVAAVLGPHHPPATSIASSSSSSTRHEFGLMPHHHHQERPPQAAGPIGSLLEEDQRTRILREDFERVRCYGMHPHTHLSNPLLPSASHAAHLDQLHPALLSHTHSHQPGSSARHPNLYSRLGPLHPHSHHLPNGLLTKTPSGLVGSLSVGPPPPLIPSVTPGRASTSPRNSRVGGGHDLALYGAPKDRESR